MTDVPSPSAARNADWWVQAQFVSPDPALAWRLTDPDLRLARVQSWFWSTGRIAPAYKAYAQHFAREGPGVPGWQQFQEWSSDLWSMHLGPFFDEPWGLADVVDPIGVDLEMVVFARTETWDEEESFAPGQPVLGQVVIMRLRDTWRVAGVGRVIAVPGWPPTSVTVR